MSDAEAPNEIEAAMEKAAAGDSNAVREFFEHLVDARVVVLRRTQQVPLQHLPAYPNEVIDILGIQERDRVIIPIFLRPEYIEQWCGSPLLWRALSFSSLIQSIPDDWWLCINPGGEVEKEISPWELRILSSGKEGISDIVEELDQDKDDSSSVEAVQAIEKDYEQLCDELRNWAEGCAPVRALFLIAQDQEAEAPQGPSRLVLIGVLTTQIEKEESVKLREEASAAARVAMIGNDPCRVLIGDTLSGDISLSIFQNVPPIFRRLG